MKPSFNNEYKCKESDRNLACLIVMPATFRNKFFPCLGTVVGNIKNSLPYFLKVTDDIRRSLDHSVSEPQNT